MTYQVVRIAAVTEMVNIQYKANPSWMTLPGFSGNLTEGMARRAEKNVPGRNIMVMMATVFMEELSRLIASDSLRLLLASLCVSKLNI